MRIEVSQYIQDATSTLCLEKDQKDQVEQCISNYSYPGIFTVRFLPWFIHYIHNAFNHIRGISEWQKTEKLLTKHITTLVNDLDVSIQQSLSIAEIAQRALSLLKHYNETKKSSETLRPEDWDKGKLKNQLKKTITESFVGQSQPIIVSQLSYMLIDIKYLHKELKEVNLQDDPFNNQNPSWLLRFLRRLKFF